MPNKPSRNRFTLESRSICRPTQRRTGLIFSGSSGGGGGGLYTAGHPNQPGGFTQILTHDFAALPGTGWGSQVRNAGTIQLATDAASPASPSSVGEMVFPTPWSPGLEPGIIFNSADFLVGGQSPQRVYLDMALKISAGWEGQYGSSVNKVCFWPIGAQNNRIYFMLGGSGANPLYPEIRLQGPGLPAAQTTFNYPAAAIAANEHTRDTWIQYEFVINSGTNGNADGRITVYRAGNSTPIIDATGLSLIASPDTGKVQGWNWTPVWGGTGGATTSQTQTMRMDGLYISGIVT